MRLKIGVLRKKKCKIVKYILQAGCGIDLIIQATDLLKNKRKYIEEPLEVNF